MSEDIAVFLDGFAEAEDLASFSPAAQRILATSAALFFRSGAVATSVRDITRACGLTPGALYKHFPSKDELLDTIVRHGHHAMDKRLTEGLAAAEPGDLRARTAAFVRAYVSGHLTHPQLAQVVRREYLHLPEDRYTATVALRRRTRDRLADLLRAGQEGGVFTLVDESPTAVAMMILDMCSRTSEWYDPRRGQDLDEVADRYVRAALRLAGAPH